MTEEAQPENKQPNIWEREEAQSSGQESGTPRQEYRPETGPTGQAGGEEDRPVPSWRHREETRKRQQAERALKDLQDQQAKHEEEQASKQGEWQQVAEKRKETIAKKDARIKELESQIVRDKRFRAWTQAASGTIRPDALGDAFDFVAEEEWRATNEDDENSVRALAEGLAERKPYLGTGVVGAGSGGSSRPVMGITGGASRDINDQRSQTLSSGRRAFDFNKTKGHISR
jgi:primosomal protein N'